MYKFILLILGISTLLLADFNNESDFMSNEDLESVKSKYHIVDESPEKAVEQEAVQPETALPQIKLEVPEKHESISSFKEPLKTESVIPLVKQEILPTPKESAPKEPETLTDEDKLHKIRQELDIPELTGKAKKLDRIRHELNINYQAPKEMSYLDKRVKSVKNALHMEGDIEGEYSFKNTVRDLKETLHMEGISSWSLPSLEMPSFFGEKKKKKDKGLFGISILGGVKDTGTKIYKGMKYSGQSAEFMSGMMYNSSKLYNTMFGLFDDSPFNIFEDEDEDPSIFDLFEGGNSVMDMFN